MLAKSEHVLLRLQRVQQMHDELAHRDILSFDLYKRLKHMVLHFYKYAGNIEQARETADRAVLSRILVDTFIISMASANALNISLGSKIGKDAESLDQLARQLGNEIVSADLFATAVRELLLIGGKMAKAMESSDHLERGDPRVQMEELIPKLAAQVLGLLGKMGADVDQDVRARLSMVEAKSIFRRL